MSLPTQWRALDRLILVAGHAVYVADDFTAPKDDRSWFLQSFQRGEPRCEERKAYPPVLARCRLS